MGQAKLSVLASPTAKPVLRTKEATRLDLARGLASDCRRDVHLSQTLEVAV